MRQNTPSRVRISSLSCENTKRVVENRAIWSLIYRPDATNSISRMNICLNKIRNSPTECTPSSRTSRKIWTVWPKGTRRKSVKSRETTTSWWIRESKTWITVTKAVTLTGSVATRKPLRIWSMRTGYSIKTWIWFPLKEEMKKTQCWPMNCTKQGRGFWRSLEP